MSVLLSDLNTLINDKRRDTGSNSVDMTSVGRRAINSTIDLWQQMHDWEFTLEKTTITYHTGIDTYALPSSFKSFQDIRYTLPNSSTTEFALKSSSNFYKDTVDTEKFAVVNSTQTPRMLLKASGDSTSINTATSYNGQGTWVGASGAGTVATSSYGSYELGASVSFNLTAATAATVTNSTMNTVDLRKYKNRSGVYFRIFLPTVTGLTSLTLKWGSSASNYYSYTVTTDYIGDAFVANSWNTFKAPWASATTVGTPDDSIIGYLQLTITCSSTTATGYKIENFFASEDTSILLDYYSNNFVYDVSAAGKVKNFNDGAATTDYPLFSGSWDWVQEAFVNSVLEILFWITGEYSDYSVAVGKIDPIVTNLKKRLPTRKRNPELKFTVE